MEMVVSFRSKLLLVLIASLLLPLCGCKGKDEPLKIGFVGALTGRASGLGQEGRDAFMLALDEANRAGGIAGRPVKGVVLDHQSNPEGARQAVRRMRDAGVVAVVGPMMSQFAVSMAAEAERLALPLIGPTVSTEKLSGQSDLFFRPHYSDSQVAVKLSRHIAARKIKRVTIFQDIDNRAYVESRSSAFAEFFPGEVEIVSFSSAEDPSFSRLVDEVPRQDSGAILILANAPDTALICQQCSKQGLEVAKYATCWSASGPLVNYGGKSVERLEFLHSINVNSSAPAYREFSRTFLARYNRHHLFPAVHAYDATRILLRTLQEAEPQESIAEALLRIRNFQGLQYPLSFSDSGDLVDPPLFHTVVQDAEFCFVCYAE